MTDRAGDDGVADDDDDPGPELGSSLLDSWEPRPIPHVTPETERFWRAGTENRFLLRECAECGLVYHYPRALCPDCFGESTWRAASGAGTIYSYSVAHQVSGWPEKALPLVVAYVELEEGPRVLTNVVDCDSETIAVGTPVEVRFVPTDEERVAIPVFVPIED